MQQIELIHEVPEDALRALVSALGGPKRVGHSLLPDLPMDDARRQVDGWCSRESKYKPSLTQLAWLLREGRKIQCHVLMGFLADDAGYTATPIGPRDELAELQRAFIQSVEAQKQLLERISRVQVRAAG